MGKIVEKRKGRISAFLITLRHMLNSQSSQFISWDEQQKSFKIRNPSRFSQEVLPKYFKHSNLSSFIRQLNIYDFKKVANIKYPDQYIYSHQFFDRNQPELMKAIHRKVSSSGSKHIKNIQEEENSQWIQSENIQIQEKKILEDQISCLQKGLSNLRSANSLICEQNMQLQNSIPTFKNQNAQISKNIYQMLMGSYQIQYSKFAQKIKNQIEQQSDLMNHIYQAQRSAQVVPSSFAVSSVKSTLHEKNKHSSSNYYSTSSGGSSTGNRKNSKQTLTYEGGSRLESRVSEKRQNQLRKLNNAIQKNQNIGQGLEKIIETSLKKVQMGRNASNRQKIGFNPYKNNSNSNEMIQGRKKQNNFPEQRNQQQHTICVINLRNRSGQYDHKHDIPEIKVVPVQINKLSQNNQNEQDSYWQRVRILQQR